MKWEGIEVILEATGAVEFATRVALEAFANKKHVIAMNAELDGTLGPLLKVRSSRQRGCVLVCSLVRVSGGVTYFSWLGECRRRPTRPAWCGATRTATSPASS
jgi:hypothetical protein